MCAVSLTRVGNHHNRGCHCFYERIGAVQQSHFGAEPIERFRNGPYRFRSEGALLKQMSNWHSSTRLPEVLSVENTQSVSSETNRITFAACR